MQAAIITCMDCRLVRMLEDALDIARGDVLQLRIAGATIPDDRNSEIMKSLVAGVYLLGIREILVIGHTNCGLSHVNLDALFASMQAWGVDPQTFAQSVGATDDDDILRWLGAFNDVHMNVKEVVLGLRKSPILPNRIPIHGLVIDIITGKLKVVDRG